MERFDLIVVGAGPAGLSAAVEAARLGLKVIVFDENEKPGGQLFKQIHKFFGSKEHKAKMRGFKIGEELLEEANILGVKVVLGASVIGLYLDKEVTVKQGETLYHYKGDTVIVATGASENMVVFKGWTLPGVIGAGAAQTMMNLHHVKPGHRVLMLGSGNVGLVVSYQLLQAGCEVVAVVDAAPRIGGYGVHASKVARCGVPFYLSHTIIEAIGDDCVTGVTIGEVNDRWELIEGSQKSFEVDTICMAVGLSPTAQLLSMAGCEMKQTQEGYVPVIQSSCETSVKGIFVAGDASGIEEASSAMIEGRIAGLCAAYQLGYIEADKMDAVVQGLASSLEDLRAGMFAPENRGKLLTHTEEGYLISSHLLKTGYLSEDEIENYPGTQKAEGLGPIIECTQNIPCNPCQEACRQGCIRIGEQMTALPAIDSDKKCTGCGLCVASCSGQAIFLVDETLEADYASVTIPYEFLPLPEKGDSGVALDRSGSVLCQADILEVRSLKIYDKTHLLTMRVPKDMAMRARFYKKEVVS